MKRKAAARGHRLLLRGASYELLDERPMMERMLRTEGVQGLLVAPNMQSPQAAEVMAMIEAALSAGISVPGDLSIVSYDDEIAELMTPPLTAVKPPRAEVGAAAVDLLLDRLEHPGRALRQLSLTPALTIRESTGPAPA